MTIDQLFTYNASLLDGNGNYMYNTWVESINDGIGLSIIGTPNGSRAIPLWDLLDTSGSSNVIKSYLIKAYASLCGDKYNEYLTKYPTIERTITSSDASTGACNVSGYSVSYKNNTLYYEDENTTGEYNVLRDSTIFMDYTDTIPAGQKEWKIINGESYVNLVDNVTGIFKVNNTTTNNKTFTVGLYGNNILLYSKQFTVVQEAFSGGDGSETAPYLISTKEDFKTLCRESQYWGKYIKLTNSIDFENEEINCIGNESNAFSGVFDGNNCFLKNFKILTPCDASLALFAYNLGTIKNLNIDTETVGYGTEKTDVSIKFSSGLVGYNKGNVLNCKIENLTLFVRYDTNAVESTLAVGGLIGLSDIPQTSNAKIEKCALINISLIGRLNDESQTNTCNVYVGGLIGQVKVGCTIENSYLKNIGNITAQSRARNNRDYVGGLIGFVDTATMNIKYCVIGSIQTMISATQSFPTLNEREKHSFVGKNINGTLEILNTYVTTNSNGLGIESDKISIQDTITITSADKLSLTIWCSDVDQFPILKNQKFNPNTAIQVVSNSGIRSFYYGQAFNIAGIKVEGQYASGGDAINIDTFSYDASNYNATVLGNHHTIKINAMGYQTTYTVTVRKIEVVGLKLTALNNEYYVGEQAVKNDYQVEYILENGDIISPTDELVNYINYPTADINIVSYNYVLGNNKIIAECGSLSTSVVVNAIEKTVLSIAITQQPNKLTYFVGQNFNTDGLEVTATYSDNSVKVINNNELEIMGSRIALGNNELILSYDNYKTCTLSVIGESIPINNYTIKFIDYDNSLILETVYEENSEVTEPEHPTREADYMYTYEFSNWDSVIIPATEDKTYTAQYTPTFIDYTIIFKNADNTIISTNTYHYNDDVVIPTNPTKTADNTYTYVFAGWDKTITKAVKNETYIATYTPTFIDYTIVFKNADSSIISTNTYHYNDDVVIPTNPTKTADNTYTYAFAGWDKTITKAVMNETYTATYTPTFIDYTITFKNYNNDILSSQTCHYDEIVVPPANPIKLADNTYTYSFAGWDKTITKAIKNETYIATYTPTFIDYTIVFKNYNGDILSSQTYHYGDLISPPTTPTKPSNEEFKYEFLGWDKQVNTVTGNMVFIAQYSEKNINSNNKDNNSNSTPYIIVAGVVGFAFIVGGTIWFIKRPRKVN